MQGTLPDDVEALKALRAGLQAALGRGRNESAARFPRWDPRADPCAASECDRGQCNWEGVSCRYGPSFLAASGTNVLHNFLYGFRDLPAASHTPSDLPQVLSISVEAPWPNLLITIYCGAACAASSH